MSTTTRNTIETTRIAGKLSPLSPRCPNVTPVSGVLFAGVAAETTAGEGSNTVPAHACGSAGPALHGEEENCHHLSLRAIEGEILSLFIGDILSLAGSPAGTPPPPSRARPSGDSSPSSGCASGTARAPIGSFINLKVSASNE
jgi:hypothetical protein